MAPPRTIDRATRLRYAEILRHFAAGRMTNYEYVSATAFITKSADPAPRAIFRAVWRFYDDLHEHRLNGKHRLSCANRRAIARAIVFLHSSQPFEWPFANKRHIALSLVTLGLWNRLRPSAGIEGDPAVWPFQNRTDLDVSASSPRLLCGATPIEN